MTYPNVESQPNLPLLEQGVQAFWEADRTFEASVEQRAAGSAPGLTDNEYIFYDGPPFANGLPHYGHLLTGYVKDAVPRYQTMRGRRVERRFGWDCHGLPAEVEAEKELGISGHPEIAEFGIDKFNDACRTSVLRYTSEWERYVGRQARWVDFANDYKTLDLTYMESVMWAFRTLYNKGLIYEGFRVLAYCWRCETPLSNTETRMDDVYRDRQDPALTVAFELESGEHLLAWTTTPWTLPANLALAVGPEIEYAVMQHGDGRRYILAASRLEAYERELGDATQVATIVGSDLVGRAYAPLFDFLADTPNAFQVLSADFVSTEDGTGVVHLAPGFGEDDQNVCNAVGIPTICPMDEHGRYTEPFMLARSLCLLAARAAGVVPIDAVFTDFRDSDALTRETNIARRDGFSAKAAIHPAQVEIINSCFTPTEDERRWAKRVLAAFDASSSGAVQIDGVMLDAPHRAQALRIMAAFGQS